jgi:3-oxoacyl-[acyl-carrier protein] reductase
MTKPSTAKAALITGAARGLGRAMALGLAKAGYNIAACDLPASAAELAALSAEAEGHNATIYPVHCDVTDSVRCVRRSPRCANGLAASISS